MRDLNANALAKIATTKGIEPVVIIDVNWHGDNVSQYADKEVETISGKILEVADLDAVVNISSSSDTQEINITLIDIDGSIKNIMDNNDIHMRDVSVYQWFEGLALTDRFLLFKGKINSPIVWNESKRTLSFDVVSNLEDNEIGYSVEEGLWESMPKSVVGQAWPMCFGTTVFSKCLRMTGRVKGTLADGLSFHDSALLHRAAVISGIRQRLMTKMLAGVGTRDIGWSNQQALDATQSYGDQVSAIHRTLSQQPSTNTAPRIINGDLFPQGKMMYVRIGSTTFYGKIQGNIFHFSGLDQHPNIGDFHCPPGSGLGSVWNPMTSLDYVRQQNDGRTGFCTKVVPHEEITVWRQFVIDRWIGGWYKNGQVGGDNTGYVYIEPGATVEISEAEPQTYVVSIVPGTVLRVSAWAEKDNQRFLQDIDPNDYRVYTEQYGTLTVTFLEINDALSKRRGFNWEDDVYVIFESDVGPNTVEILQYIIETYSDFTVDAASFAAAAISVENYPSHFAILDRRELFTVLQEIAWQARCAIWLKNGVFYIKYLPDEPTPIATITESDVRIESMTLEHTPTEDLVTKMVGEWRESGLQDDPYTTILRHNISKYGTHEESYDFYIYNFVDAVIKSMTFWITRYSNTWKKLKFTVPLTLLNVETFDAVELDFASNYVANTSVIAMVENSIYNSADNLVEILCWCPVKAGTMTPYIFAYPAAVDETETFPTDFEYQEGFDGGNSPGKDNIRRVGFGSGIDIETLAPIFRGPANDSYDMTYSCTNPGDKGCAEGEVPGEEGGGGDARNADTGNPTPSDVGDEYPGPQIVYPGETLGPNEPGAESIAPIGTPFEENTDIGTPYDLGEDFAQAARDAEQNRVGDADDPNNLPDPTDLPDNPCNAEVLVFWTGPIVAVTKPCSGFWTVDQINAGVMTQPGTQGRAGYANESLTEPERFTFNTCEAAQAFVDAMTAYILSCHYIVGQPSPMYISFSAVYCQFNCDDPESSSRDDGMIGYRPTNGQGEFPL